MENNTQLRRKLAKLQLRNRKLKQENIKLKKENKKLYRENRVYRRQIKRSEPIRSTPQEDNNIYRYSIAYYSGYMDRAFRGEIYTDHKANAQMIESRLIAGLTRWISLQNKGLQKNFNASNYLGIENERVGDNDRGKAQLNRMFFFMD